MRIAVKATYPFGVAFNPVERDADVENRLRTYMINGNTPEELEEYARFRRQEQFAQWAAMMEQEERKDAEIDAAD